MIFILTALLVASILLIFTLKKAARLELLSPPVVMSLMWAFLIVASLIFFTNYSWGYYGLIWIMLGCLAYMLGYIAIASYKKSEVTDNKIRKSSIKRLRASLLLTILIVAGVTYAFMYFKTYGIDWSTLLSLDQLAETNNSIAVARYTGNLSASLAMQVLLAAVYAAPMLGGFLLPYAENKRQRVFYLMSLLPIILTFSVTNEKATFIASIIFIVSGYITGYMNKNGNLPKVKTRHAIGMLVGFVVLLTVLVSSMMLRIGTYDSATFEVALQKVGNSYALSEVPAFDDAFQKTATVGYLTIGKYTFYGVANALGASNREQGIYNDYFSYGEITTNVYSAFRGLILDFGAIGALCFLFICGAITAFAVYKVRVRGRSGIAAGTVVAALAFIFFSFAASIFSYTSFIIAFVVFTMCCSLILMQAGAKSRA